MRNEEANNRYSVSPDKRVDNKVIFKKSLHKRRMIKRAITAHQSNRAAAKIVSYKGGDLQDIYVKNQVNDLARSYAPNAPSATQVARRSLQSAHTRFLQI